MAGNSKNHPSIRVLMKAFWAGYIGISKKSWLMKKKKSDNKTMKIFLFQLVIFSVFFGLIIWDVSLSFRCLNEMTHIILSCERLAITITVGHLSQGVFIWLRNVCIISYGSSNNKE